ncbi:MAG TPA: conjugal transfer protein TraN, partial [Agitococcus sp.]|nr:conjugal transfer protein TraN [Agitococcus sp.]
KVAGICVEKLIHYEYCVWPSKLARMVQDQGMAQLGQAITNACRGFKLNSPNEISMLDFSKIDLSEYFTDVVNKLNSTTLPDPNVMLNQTQSSVPAMADKLNERYKDYGR